MRYETFYFTRLAEALGVADRHPRSFRTIVALCIDSSDVPEDVSGILRFHGVEHRSIAGVCAIDRSQIAEALRKEVFTGWDEVLLFDDDPFDADLRNLPAVMMGGEAFDDAPPAPELIDAFGRSGCWAALGDGSSLNCLTSDHGYLEALREFDEQARANSPPEG